MANKGNILLVANWESNVGYAWWLMENFWTTISTQFNAQAITSHLIYPKITQIPESITSTNIEVSECDFQNRSLKNLVKIRKLIKSNGIRYLYLSDSPAYCLFYLLLRFWGIKIIVVHDHTPGERTKPKAWLKSVKSLIQKIPFYTADHFIAVTDYVYKRHIEVNCIPPEKCSVAANGIKPINLKQADIKYTQNIFNISEDRLIIVTTGRASYYKGIDFFIECANELVNNQGFENLHFLFCGDGPDMGDFRSLANKLNIEHHFTFAGRRKDVREILPCCHIGFHAATGEVGYSLSLLEYMSAGIVTIAPDNPSTSQAIKNMESGILYPPRDLQSATEAIKLALVTDTAIRICDNAVREIQNKYSIDKTNKELIKILQTLFI